MRILLDLIYLLLLVLLSPWVLYRVLCQKRYRSGWAERFGFVRPRHSHQPAIWIHAVSMGEINAIGTLVTALEAILPQFEIVISSTTDTGMDRARKLYAQDHHVFFFPWDFSFAIRRALDRLHPQLCVMMEGETWPNFTAVAQARSIPVVVANGRVGSGKGWPRYRRVAPLVRPMFRRLRLALVQDQTYADRFAFLGVPRDRIQVVGTLKYDTAEVTDRVDGADQLGESLGLESAPLMWVAGQSGPGEEQIILDSYQQLRRQPQLTQLRLVIVPRKPERFDEVARLIESYGLPLLRYSQVKQGTRAVSAVDDGAVILGDTMGDLRRFYSLAHAVFVGRSLVPMGGSDMMEVAALGRAVIIGPYTDNFSETVDLLCQAHAMQVVHDQPELTAAVGKQLLERDHAVAMGQRARQVILDHKGATGRTVEAIVKLLGYEMPPAPHAAATPALFLPDPS